MQGERDLSTLLSSCKAELADKIFVFASIKDNKIPPNITPQMSFCEAEGLTLILHKQAAESAGLDYTFECCMITLAIHSDLEAVGFMAHISRLLADAGISVNPVAGYYHDHLFVPVSKADEAMRILENMNQKSE